MLARILQSTADKGLFPSPLSYISPYFNTPIVAQIFAVSTGEGNVSPNFADFLLFHCIKNSSNCKQLLTIKNKNWHLNRYKSVSVFSYPTDVTNYNVYAGRCEHPNTLHD